MVSNQVGLLLDYVLSTEPDDNAPVVVLFTREDAVDVVRHLDRDEDYGSIVNNVRNAIDELEIRCLADSAYDDYRGSN